MLSYENFLRQIKLRDITDEKSNEFIEFLIGIKENGKYILEHTPKRQIHQEGYRYTYHSNGYKVFSFIYKDSSYGCVVSDYFLQIVDEKYESVYGEPSDGDPLTSTLFFRKYIGAFLGYYDFSPMDIEVNEK